MFDNIDVNSVINGTFHKRIVNGYEALRQSGLTQESADTFKSIYENASLSEILDESAWIMKEPIEGLKFYEKVMTESYIPLHRVEGEISKMDEFAEHYEEMPEEQVKMYSETFDNITNHFIDRKHEVILAGAKAEESDQSAAMEACDALYAREDKDSPCEKFDNFLENASLGTKMAYGAYVLPTYNQNKAASFFIHEMAMTEAAESDVNVYTESVAANIYASFLFEDEAVRRDFSMIPNANLQMEMLESVTTNYREVIDDIFTEYKSMSDIIYVSPESAVEKMFDDDKFYEAVEDDSIETRVVNAAKAKAVLESVLDIVFAEYMTEFAEDADLTTCKAVLDLSGAESMTIKEAMDYLTEKVNNMEDIIKIGTAEESGEDDSFFEYTRRGEATPTIRKTAGNLREEPLTVNKNGKSSTGKSTSQRDDSSDDDDFDDEDEDGDDESDEFDRKRERTPNNKPKLQKQSMTRKIQNKAIDMDVKMQKKAGKAKQGLTELKNAAKSVLRIPGNIVNALKGIINDWETMSEEKRKQKILEPGYRKKVFKMLKIAIQYGAVWAWKKHMVIVLFICKHTLLSPLIKAKEADEKRLRNELTAELETEIAVTEEKIQDANSNGDQKQKYELIRIKKKLEAEKIRVSANSAYI